MGKKRVHELAKEYGIDTREVLQRLQAAGVDVKSHSSSVYEEEARAVLGKPKATEVAEAPATSPRRPGMLIVKKKKEVEPEVAAVASADADEAMGNHESHIEPEVVAKPESMEPSFEQEAEPRVSEMPEPTPEPTRSGGDEAKAPPARPVAAERAPAPARVAPSAPARHRPNEPAATTASSSQPSPRPPVETAAGPRLGSRPGAATVVRMIDREKLMERVPSRRLGGVPGGDRRAPREGGGPSQRFGQVTELKVVTDPFGRGREMINVGRDRKQKQTTSAGKAPKKERAPSKRDLLEMRERVLHPSRLKKKKTMVKGAKKTELTERKASKRVIRMKESIVVAELAHELGVKVTEIIAKLMSLGLMVAQNQTINFETAQLVAADYEYTVESTAFDEEGALESTEAEAEDTNLQPRPAVVTVMGHVDHGKTSVLDAIRQARVAAGEAGGITQHIGAYQVNVPERGRITFLDTPGHAAFTAMRARGAQVTDLVVLVVAADDGVMPQTEEAVKHAQAAQVPMVVAINKIDKPDAQPERVMQELASKFGLTPEAWGGETLYVSTSATKGRGIPELLEAVFLQAEVLELKANPDRAAVGIVLEAKLDRGRGPVATVLVQNGTLHRGDAVVVGEYAGKVRAMQNDLGASVDEAGPSGAVEITGLEGVPEAGDTLHAVDSADKAREIAEHRAAQKKAQEGVGRTAMTLEEMMKRMTGEGGLELKIVLKADVQGSVEAVRDALLALSTPEVKVNVVYAGVGGVKESDITLAAASKGIVLGFNVRPDANARDIAEREGVEIRSYNIIYEVLDEIRLALQGLLAPESREKMLGHAEVREVFRITKVGQIAGCRVTDGKAMRSARVRVVRDSVQIHDGRVSSLKHFKNDVREVDAGQECGVGIEDYNDIKVGDVLEFYQIEEIARTLPSSAVTGKRPVGGPGVSAHP
jgi:translation initiation factor IF-2